MTALRKIDRTTDHERALRNVRDAGSRGLVVAADLMTLSQRELVDLGHLLREPYGEWHYRLTLSASGYAIVDRAEPYWP